MKAYYYKVDFLINIKSLCLNILKLTLWLGLTCLISSPILHLHSLSTNLPRVLPLQLVFSMPQENGSFVFFRSIKMFQIYIEIKKKVLKWTEKSAGTKLAAAYQYYICHCCCVFILTGWVQDGSSSHGIFYLFFCRKFWI